MKDKEIKKCLVCAFSLNHKFKECASPVCECNCLSEIRGKVPLNFNEYPQWFRIVSRKDAQRFSRAHTKKGI